MDSSYDEDEGDQYEDSASFEPEKKSKKRAREKKSKSDQAKTTSMKKASKKKVVHTVASTRKALKASKSMWVKSKKGGHITIPSVVRGCESVLEPFKDLQEEDVTVDILLSLIEIVSFAVSSYENECIGDSYGEMGCFVSEVDSVLADAIKKADVPEGMLNTVKEQMDSSGASSYGWELEDSLTAIEEKGGGGGEEEED